MEVHESLNTAFTIITTRFKEGKYYCSSIKKYYKHYCYVHTAPDVIIYDNACNLHAYCLNRNPKFFQKTWFLVDRFNHTGIINHITYSLITQAN